MRETRRLDILAVTGVLLSVLLFGFYLQTRETFWSVNDLDRVRLRLIERMPDPEIGTDFGVITAYEREMFPNAWSGRARILENALKSFPSSPRIQLRAGAFMEGPRSVEALRHASRLDPGNALPLYLLASQAASRGSASEAIRLLREGNDLTGFTMYPMPDVDMGAGMSAYTTLVMSATTTSEFPIQTSLRKLARAMGDHAERLRVSGRTDEGLRVLNDVEQMAQASMHGNQTSMMSVQVGQSLMRIALKHEEKIYAAQRSQSGLAHVSKEKEYLRYLSAGTRFFIDQFMHRVMRTMQRFLAPAVSVVSLVCEVYFSIGLFLALIFLTLRSRGRAASDAHAQATESALRILRLVKYYALMFIPLGLVGSLIFRYAGPPGDPLLMTLAVMPAALAPAFLLQWRAGSLYKRAYLQILGADAPKPWKGYPVADRREFVRRMSGVHGGAVIFLVIWGLLVSGGMKLTMGVVPWNPSSMMDELAQQERVYMRDLVEQRIPISEETIRRIERDEKRRDQRSIRESPRSKSDAKRSPEPARPGTQ